MFHVKHRPLSKPRVPSLSVTEVRALCPQRDAESAALAR